MKKFIRNFAGFSLGPIVAAIISFITIPILTMFIVPEEFGKASMFTVVQITVMSFIYLGMDQSFTREYHLIKDKNKLYSNTILLPLVFAIIFFLFTIVFKKSFAKVVFGDASYFGISVLFGLLVIFIVFERFTLLLIRMEERAVTYSIFNILLKLNVLILSIVFLCMGEKSFLTIVYSNIFGQILTDIMIILYKKSYKYIDYRLLDIDYIKSLLRFGLPILVSTSLITFLNTSGRFFLRAEHGFYDIGIYTAALKISSVIAVFQNAFTGFWVPVSYRWHKENKNIKYFQLVSDSLLLILSVASVVLFLFKDWIVIILSENYIDSKYVFPLLIIVPITYTISETTTLGIVFSGKSYLNIINSILALIPNLLLNIILVPSMGVKGTAIAQAFSYFIFYFSRSYFSKKCGYNINTKISHITIFVLFVGALLNVFDLNNIIYLNLLILVAVIIIQKNTILYVISYIREKQIYFKRR